MRVDITRTMDIYTQNAESSRRVALASSATVSVAVGESERLSPPLRLPRFPRLWGFGHADGAREEEDALDDEGLSRHRLVRGGDGLEEDSALGGAALPRGSEADDFEDVFEAGAGAGAAAADSDEDGCEP